MKTSDIVKNVIVLIIAIVYSTILGIGALLIAGAGDGSYVFLGLISSPLNLLSLIIKINSLSFISIPILWILVGYFAIVKDYRRRYILLRSFLIAHYLGAVIVLSMPEPFGNWGKLLEIWNFQYGKTFILCSLSFYLLGQIWIWIKLIDSFRHQKADNK